MNTALNIITTQDGKFVGQVYVVNNGTAKPVYETPEYLTRDMAYADANCWDNFHGEATMTETAKPAERTIVVSDTVRTLAAKNGKPQREWTGPQFIKWISGAKLQFPQMTIRTATEFDHRKTQGNDYFLIIQATPQHRERCFIVKKHEESDWERNFNEARALGYDHGEAADYADRKTNR